MTNFHLQFLDVEKQSRTFGDWLRENRKIKYLTMQALADKVGMSKQYISVLERAEPHPLTDKPVTPTVEKVELLAKALEVDIDEAREAAGYSLTRPRNSITIYTEGLTTEDIENITRFANYLKWQRENPDKKPRALIVANEKFKILSAGNNQNEKENTA